MNACFALQCGGRDDATAGHREGPAGSGERAASRGEGLRVPRARPAAVKQGLRRQAQVERRGKPTKGVVLVVLSWRTSTCLHLGGKTRHADLWNLSENNNGFNRWSSFF